MRLSRRREPLHERLAREGGLGTGPNLDPRPRWGEVGIHGVARLREWDAVVVVDAPQLAGDEVAFVVLPDRTLLIEEAAEGADVQPLAEAVEETLEPPYRAEGVRRERDRWAVGARRIQVVELPEDVAGNEIELAVNEGARTVLVDGGRSFGSLPELEAVGVGDSYVVRASRLDGPLWEVETTQL